MLDYSIQPLKTTCAAQAIRLRELGKRTGEIALYLGVHRTTVSKWWQQYQQFGEAALHQQKRGNRLGEGRTLSSNEEAWVQQLMREHFPDELNIDSALWTRSAVQTLISYQCGVKMPIRTVGEYLKRWGMTPQKPLKRAYEQDPQRVKIWLDIEYPAIEQRAEAEDAEIAWGDESFSTLGCSNWAWLCTCRTHPRNPTKYTASQRQLYRQHQ